jgi:hypothetical protein
VRDAMKLLANSFNGRKQFDNALKTYQDILEKFESIQTCDDNSHLINKFISFYPSLKQYYTLIGITQGSGKVDNYTFPKGKLSFDDKTLEDCCFREFTEETGKTFLNNETELQIQIEKRNTHNIRFVPHSIIINNFYLRIIIV